MTAKYFNNWSGLTNFQFVRIYYALPFVICSIAAVAWTSLLTPLTNGTTPGRHIGRLLMGLGVIWVLGHQGWVKLNELKYYGHGANYETLYNNPAIRAIADIQGVAPPFRVATLTIDGVTHLSRSSHAWAMGLESIDGYTNIYPWRYHEFWMALIAPAAGKIVFDYNKMRDWGNRLYLIAKADDCNNIRLSTTTDMELLSLSNVRFIISPCPLVDEHLRKFSENRNGPGQAWHKLSKLAKLRKTLAGEFPSEELFVYENPDYMPRFFLAGDAVVHENIDAVANTLKTSGIDSLRNTAQLVRGDVKDIELNSLPGGASGTVTVVTYEKDRIVLDVQASAPTILVATNSFN